MANTLNAVSSSVTERPMSDRPMLAMSGIVKRFGANQVLRGVSLTVARGETVVVIGPSGSGKTTLLRCVNMLEDYQAGTVTVDGEPVGYMLDRDGQRQRMMEREIAAARENIGIVFQSYNLFPHMTALQNIVAAPIRVRGIPRAKAEARARDLLAMVGLSDKEDAYPARLSGGQQQRVAIARALAMDPKIMLFDEVTSALDPELVGEVLKVMQKLAEEGRTMIVVTHEMGFARNVSNHVMFLHQGRTEEEGAPAEVLSTPRSERLKQFLSGSLK
jgi:histidine transport system ATP-binding protein